MEAPSGADGGDRRLLGCWRFVPLAEGGAPLTSAASWPPLGHPADVLWCGRRGHVAPLGPQPRIRSLPLAGTSRAAARDVERIACRWRVARPLAGNPGASRLTARPTRAGAVPWCARCCRRRELRPGALNRPLFSPRLESRMFARVVIVLVSAMALVADLTLVSNSKRAELACWRPWAHAAGCSALPLVGCFFRLRHAEGRPSLWWRGCDRYRWCGCRADLLLDTCPFGCAPTSPRCSPSPGLAPAARCGWRRGGRLSRSRRLPVSFEVSVDGLRNAYLDATRRSRCSRRRPRGGRASLWRSSSFRVRASHAAHLLGGL